MITLGGRRKEPVDLLLIKGKSNHLTKAEIEERRAAELVAPTDNIKYPRYLPKDLRRDYKYYSEILCKLGIFSNLDVDTLARYLMQRKEYLKVSDLMSDMSPLEVEKRKVLDEDGDFTGEYRDVQVKNEAYDSLRIHQSTFYTQCRQAASDLGLTVSSRLKLVIPKVPEKGEVSEFEQRFGSI